MTRELTREFLEQAGFAEPQYWFDKWHIFRYWYNSGGKVKVPKEIKIINARCKHKYTHDKYYPIFCFRYDGRNYSVSLSKFLYAWFYGKVPAGYDVDHKDNNPYNNVLDNLQLLTRQENIRKRYTDNPKGWLNQHGNKRKK